MAGKHQHLHNVILSSPCQCHHRKCAGCKQARQFYYDRKCQSQHGSSAATTGHAAERSQSPRPPRRLRQVSFTAANPCPICLVNEDDHGGADRAMPCLRPTVMGRLQRARKMARIATCPTCPTCRALLRVSDKVRASCGSLGFLEEPMMDITIGRAPLPARAELQRLKGS